MTRDTWLYYISLIWIALLVVTIPYALQAMG